MPTRPIERAKVAPFTVRKENRSLRLGILLVERNGRVESVKCAQRRHEANRHAKTMGIAALLHASWLVAEDFGCSVLQVRGETLQEIGITMCIPEYIGGGPG